MEKRLTKKDGAVLTRRNLPAEERRREMLAAAVELFAIKGMGITIQALADRVNVSQPLVHRYFPTKTMLIGAIFDTIQNAHWDPAWRLTLTDRTRPLDARIDAFYGQYLPHIHQDRWYRGFWFAALEDPTFAEAYIRHVERELLTAIVGEVRALCSCPTLSDVPMFEREMELVWGMHSSAIFFGIRRYVYHAPVAGDLPAVIRDQIRAYLQIAPQVLAELLAI